MRKFDTGATRNDDTEKHDYEGYLSPLALEAYGEYMTKHRHLEDGTLRASDNWQKGIPTESLVKSLLRHAFAVWMHHRGYGGPEDLKDGLSGVIFNAMAYLHEVKKRDLVVVHKPGGLSPITPWLDPRGIPGRVEAAGGKPDNLPWHGVR